MKPFQSLLLGVIAALIVLELVVLLWGEQAPVLYGAPFFAMEDITIEGLDHQKRNKAEDKPFSRHEGGFFGLNRHSNFSILEFFQPTSRTRGIAAGDFNNDGWEDILLATNRGVLLYKNLGGRFAFQDSNFTSVPNLALGVHVVAFVDIDNDAWQDIYLTTYGGKNYVFLNDKEGFQNPKVLEVPNTGAMVTLAASFGDIDKDGDLDLAQGNWLALFFLPLQAGAETNKLITNDNLEFTEQDLQEFRGHTLSVLLADFTNDHNLDLIDGEEFELPDNFLVGDGKGGLRLIKKSDGLIPATAWANMGMDVADFNNDLYMDIYASGQSTVESFTENPCRDIQDDKERRQCEGNFRIIDMLKQEDTIETCAQFSEEEERNACMVMVTLNVAVEGGGGTELCGKIPRRYAAQRLMCFDSFIARPSRSTARSGQGLEEAIPQLPGQNVLLQGSRSGTFQEVAQEKGAHDGYNSWNAKFADLDNDEWQDIYIGNGELIQDPGSFQPNVFFRNYGGEYFLAEQEEFGLEHTGITNSYVYVDIDNDGDLDIVLVDLNGPLTVYRNNEDANNAITFEFRDYQGNRFGIGTKVYISYGEDEERHQVRQIKSGGGYLSFDPPIAYFGLGKYHEVTRVEIVWSTGEQTTLQKKFLANKKYIVTREPR